MSIVLGLLGMIICGLLLGYVYIVFLEKNSEEPEVKRKWSDPKFRDE